MVKYPGVFLRAGYTGTKQVYDMKMKKPKIWNIAILTGILLIVLAVLIRDPDHIPVLPVSIVFLVYLVLDLICLVSAFFRQLKYNLYSYNVVYYLGFALLNLTVLISHIKTTLNIAAAPEISDIHQIFFDLMESTDRFMRYFIVIVLISALMLILSNLMLLFTEGLRLIYVADILIALLLILGEVLLFRETTEENSLAVNMILLVCYALYLYFECMLIGASAAVAIAAKRRPAKDRDYIIILGCNLKEDGTPAPILASRIDEAMKFYQEQIAETGKVPILIPSGGKGSEKRSSESEAMTAYLLERNVPSSHIIKEDQSTTTQENMLFAKKIIFERDPAAKISFATSDYHVFRSGIMAGHAGLKAIGIGAKTKWYFWPNAALREFLGLITSHVVKQLLVLLVVIVILTLPAILFFLT